MIRPTFLSFETAKKALNTSQLGLDTVGHNISNVNTPGYTRQRVDQISIGSSGYRAKYQIFGTQLPGMGSEAIGINQIRDPFLDKRYRTEAAGCGEYAAISSGLADINAIFDEITTTGSHAKMSEFLEALDKLIASADSKEQATVLRNKAQQIAQVLNKNASELDNVETQQREDLGYSIEEVNNILEQIATLNTKIREDNFYGNPSNELNDERNLLIDQLSEYINIDVKHTPVTISDGRVIQSLSIVIRGSGDEKNGVPPTILVDSGTYHGLELNIDETTGEASIGLIDGLSGMPIPLYKADGTRSSDVTASLTSGALKGTLDILNGKGIFAGYDENSFRGIPYYRQALDDYAARFADALNNMNALKVYGPNGEVASIQRPLMASNDGGPITAASLAISQEWLNNPTYINTAAKNNALYTDADGYLYTRDGDTMTQLGVKYTDVGGIDKDGYLLDTNGARLLDGANPIGVDTLQRAITVESIAPLRMLDFLDGSGGLVAADGTPYTAGNFEDANGVAYTDFDGWTIDDDGYLLDVNGNQVILSATGSPVKITDLTQQTVSPVYRPGEPTPNELLPGESANDALLSLKIDLTTAGQPYANGFKGSFQEYLVSFQSDMALDKEQNDALMDACYSVLATLADNRDAVSAVNIDEEGINMMTYQNFYNAAARYMTVLDEALGTIIQGMGVVGR